MPRSLSTKDKIAYNINTMSSDFACLKASVLERASRISGEIDQITIGPDSVACTEDAEKTENIENSQNSYNIESTKKSVHLSNNKISMHKGIKFSIKKILSEEELQRKERVWKEMERHWQNMNENERVIQEHMALSLTYMARERERKSAEKFADILAEEERIAEQEELRRRHEQQLHARLAQEQKERLEREVEEYNRMKEKEEVARKIITLRKEAGIKYYDIIMITECCKDKNCLVPVYTIYVEKLNKLLQQMKHIDEKIKTGQLESFDLMFMENVVQNIAAILSSYRLEIEKINAAYDEQQAICNAQAAQESTPTEVVNEQTNENIEVVQKILPQQTEVNNAVISGNKNNIVETKDEKETVNVVDVPQSVSVITTEEPASASSVEQKEQLENQESWQMYIRSQCFLQDHINSYKEFLESSNTKKFRFDCQKAINIPVNAVSAINGDHLRDKYERLSDLLTGKSPPHVRQHAHGEKFCKDVLAKKIVNQGETLVSSKPKMAFAISAITVAIWNDHADFGELLLSHFYKACPFIVPVFIPRREGQSNEDYYKSLGYKYSEDGVVEKQDKYLKRISGLMRLYASITVTSQRKGVTKCHPHGLQNAWRWLATILNSEPRADVSDICATLILDMLEVTGNSLWTAYPTQFKKLLIVLKEDYYPNLAKISSGIGGGPLVRLDEFLKSALTYNTIAKAEGILSATFW